MNISIIIPTYNRGEYLDITIQSFLELNYPKDQYEIIIVDNNSSDNTKEIVKQFINNPFNVKVYYFFEPRQGVHYARNTAAKKSNFELLYFTDDDMLADAELLNEIIKLFNFDKNVAISTGKVLPKWEVNPPKWILKYCNNYLLSLLDPNYDLLISTCIEYLYSCHMAIKRETFFKVEGFNPEYTKNKYMGDGESGLNAKAKALGYKFGYNSKSIIFHMIFYSRFTQKYLNNRFANNGIAHSYSAFKLFPTNTFLIKQIIKKIFFLFPKEFIIGAFKPIIKCDISLYRFLLAICFYYSSSILFDTKILLNHNLKKFVLKKDWLSNDQEFDKIKI